MIKKAVIANRGADGSGVRNSLRRFFMDSCFRRNDRVSGNDRAGGNENSGRNIDKAITAGRSMAKRVIQGFTCTEPKQPQESAPVRAL